MVNAGTQTPGTLLLWGSEFAFRLLALPVPLKLMVWVPFAFRALSVSTTVPLMVPTAVGVKLTGSVQE